MESFGQTMIDDCGGRSPGSLRPVDRAAEQRVARNTAARQARDAERRVETARMDLEQVAAAVVLSDAGEADVERAEADLDSAERDLRRARAAFRYLDQIAGPVGPRALG